MDKETELELKAMQIEINELREEITNLTQLIYNLENNIDEARRIAGAAFIKH